MNRQIVTALLLVGLVLAGGCATFRTSPPTPATTSVQFNAVWDATLAVLRSNHFVVDRADRRAGVITTEPLLARHWFEFWRDDAVTRRDVSEGTVQTLYRRAVVQVARTEANGEDPDYAASVVIQTSRSAMPSVRVTSTSEAYELFYVSSKMLGGREAALAEPDLNAEPTNRPVQLGPDKRLADRLGAQITHLAAKKLMLAPAP